MPVSVRLTAASLLVLAGVVLLVVSVLGARSALRRNRWAGVRTDATLRSAASFTVANRAAAVPVGAAGAIAAAGGAVLFGGAGADGPLGWVVLAVSVIGLLVLAGVGGVVGDRAAASVQVAVPAAACAGACAGCDLVAGCVPLDG